MKLNKSIFSLVAAACLTAVLAISAFAVPGLINYQGRLTDSGGSPVTGDRDMRFGLYTTASGGGALWTETQTVSVAEGVFDAVLGTYSSIGGGLFGGDALYLGITVGTDAEMTPRQRLTSVAYAYKALNVSDGTVTDAKIAGPISESKIDAAIARDTEIMPSVLENDGAGSGLDADKVDAMHADDIIDAAADEVRIPIDHVPFTISSPGSYYFTGDLTYTNTSGSAISVNTDNVTIDLMGYSLIGPGKTSGSSNGVYGDSRSNVEIRNGTIRDFGAVGITLINPSASSNRAIGVRAIGNGAYGIYLYGSGHIVKDCTASGNASDGIYAGSGSTVAGNTCSANTGRGINTSYGCTVTGNTCYSNIQIGIYTNYGSTVTGNTCYDNTSHGIFTNDGVTVTNNTCFTNGADGIKTGIGNIIYGNTCKENTGNGIYSNGYPTISDCSCNNNGGDGIRVFSFGGTVSGNTCSSNYGNGIYGYSGCTIVCNSLHYNNLTGGETDEGGIYVYNGCLVKGNTLYSNGVNGIYVSSNDNTIEENLVTSSTNGINFVVTGNFYANNRASGNTNNYTGNVPTGSGDGGGNASF